ncbi:MAG: FitA-like ribbon-helix-helix domain-containing protein [Pseudomonadota bacterium]
MASITVENLPEELYEQLKRAAKAHHRSVDGELIHCLEKSLRPRPMSVEEKLARLRRVRPAIPPDAVEAGELEDAIEQGRP